MRVGAKWLARLGAGWAIVVAPAACLAMVLASLASAETLNGALTKTYLTSPDLAADQAHLRSVDEDVSQANARWRPALSIEGDVERSSETDKDRSGKYNMRSETWSADVVATQPIFSGGRNGAEKKMAMARVHGARAKLRVTEQRVLLDAVTAYVDVARNEAVFDLVRQDVTLLQGLLKEVVERRDRKEATDSDFDQTLAALEAARSECISHLAELQDSWRAYEQVVGEAPMMAETPVGQPPRVNPCVDARGERARALITMPDDLPAAPGSLEEVEAATQGDVPDLAVVRADEEESRHAVSAAYAELLPHADITAKVGTSGENYDPQSLTREASINAEITIPIFDTGSEWSKIRAARERNNEARLNITSRQREVARDAVHAWYDLVSIRAVRSVNKRQAATLQRAFEGLHKEMADPKLHRSITDLLGLRQAALGAQMLLVASHRDEVVAVHRLLASMGKLNAAYLGLPVQVYDPDANLKIQATRIMGDSIHGE